MNLPPINGNQVRINDQIPGGIERIMNLAAATEKNSSHPIAAAFLEYADSLAVTIFGSRSGDLWAM